MLLVCPIRPGDHNPELRFALRSWEQNIAGQHDLMTVGYCPNWLKPDHHIEGNRHTSVPLAVWDNIRTVSWEIQGMDEAVYMNDDFFCLKPVDQIVPVRRDISLREHLAIFPQNAGTWWPKSLRTTLEFLEGRGHIDPPSFELHRPLIADPGLMYWAMNHWDGGLTESLPQWRTLYGVLAEVEAEPTHDVKLGIAKTLPDPDWISTSDGIWRRYEARIMSCFQKPSRWEIG